VHVLCNMHVKLWCKDLLLSSVDLEVSTYLSICKLNIFQYLDEIWTKIRIFDAIYDLGLPKNDVLNDIFVSSLVINHIKVVVEQIILNMYVPLFLSAPSVLDVFSSTEVIRSHVCWNCCCVGELSEARQHVLPVTGDGSKADELSTSQRPDTDWKTGNL